MKKNTHQRRLYTPYRIKALLFPIILITFALFTFGFAQQGQTAAPKAEPPVIYVEGQKINWGTPPFMKHHTTFVPVRDFVHSMGAALSWDPVQGMITIRRDNQTITHRVGTKSYWINGHMKTMNASSLIAGNTTFVPFRDLSQMLNASFQLWNTAEQALITVNSSNNVKQELRADMAQIDAYLRDQKFIGNVLIAEQGNILFEQGYGPAGDGLVNHPKFKSRVASISKQFTAAAIMKLAEEGKLNVHDTLQSYIPDFPRGAEITLDMLLAHTSGLPADIPRVQGATLQETVEAIKNMKLSFQPGTNYRYSNPGYVLLAYIIQEASGMSYESFLRESFFEPLGMKDTGEATPETKTIKGHFIQNNRLIESDYYVSQSGTGSLYSTVYDLLKWDQALYGDQILSQESIKQMYQPSPYKDYGYGFEIIESEEQYKVVTTGGGKGYTTIMMRDLLNERVIILLSNQEKVDVKALVEGITVMMAIKN